MPTKDEVINQMKIKNSMDYFNKTKQKGRLNEGSMKIKEVIK